MVCFQFATIFDNLMQHQLNFIIYIVHNHNIKYLFSNLFAYNCDNKFAYLVDVFQSFKATHCEGSLLKQVLKYKLII